MWTFIRHTFRRRSARKERVRVRDELRLRKTKLLVVCPPVQNCREHWKPKEWLKKLYEGKIFLRYAAQLLQDQIDRGDIFVCEHLLGAKSWKDVCTQRLSQQEHVFQVVVDHSMLGLKDRVSGKPQRKMIGILTNSEHVAKELGVTCEQSHEHEHITGQLHLGGSGFRKPDWLKNTPNRL